MVPPYSLRIPRVRRYSGYRSPCARFVYRILTFSDRPSHVVRLHLHVLISVRTPSVFLQKVWPLPLSLATTHGISFDFSSSPYLDVSVQAVPFINLWIQLMIRGLFPRGFPHSEICGSKLICSSPQLIAAYRVLRRLLVPRHSPCALSNLTKLANFSSLNYMATSFTY